jgi:hypothetical protein
VLKKGEQSPRKLYFPLAKDVDERVYRIRSICEEARMLGREKIGHREVEPVFNASDALSAHYDAIPARGVRAASSGLALN